jgi:hypothetical protein
MIIMTRKDQMREGYVSRNFHLPIEVDDKLRMMAVKEHIRFSEIATLAFKHYLEVCKNENQVTSETIVG